MRPYFCCTLNPIAAKCTRESGCGPHKHCQAVERMKGVCTNADGITFHETIISGHGPYALPQAIDIEVYDQIHRGVLPTNP